MSAPLSLPQKLSEKSAVCGILISLIFLVYPETFAHATGFQNGQAQVFEVKPLTQKDQEEIYKNQFLKYSDIVREDAYNRELTKFFEKYDSPLVENIDTLRRQPEMKRIIAISFVESTLGKHCYYNNCSGITLSNGQLKRYASRDEWIVDLNDLLQTRYSDHTYKQMMGVYVVPGSANWYNGTTRIHAELDEMENRVNNTQYVTIANTDPIILKQ